MVEHSANYDFLDEIRVGPNEGEAERSTTNVCLPDVNKRKKKRKRKINDRGHGWRREDVLINAGLDTEDNCFYSSNDIVDETERKGVITTAK